MTASRDSARRDGDPLVIGGRAVPPGERLRIELPAALLPTRTPLHLPVTVVRGKRPGPRVWVSAAVHGDELNGVEIIRLVLDELREGLHRGALIAVPIVNLFGFLQQSRYLPDRRDLNRSFPGSRRGSLAARVAHLFMTEIVERCTHGIDLHTAAVEKTNYPHVRARLEDAETRRCALAFGAPVVVDSPVRAGSLRAAATRRGIPALVYEGGEPLRFNADAIAIGVRGVLGVLRELGMVRLPASGRRQRPAVVTESHWLRARRGGLLRLAVEVGAMVRADQEVGVVADAFGDDRVPLRAPFAGIVLGRTNNPVVHGGDAVLHVGRVDRPGRAKTPTRA